MVSTSLVVFVSWESLIVGRLSFIEKREIRPDLTLQADVAMDENRISCQLYLLVED
jgi:hypothetical protein